MYKITMLNKLPNWAFSIGFPHPPTTPPPAIWFGEDTPPLIGDRVKITLGGWKDACGNVVGYKIDADGRGGSLLGVFVKPDTIPLWYKRNNPDRDVCFFNGREIAPAT